MELWLDVLAFLSADMLNMKLYIDKRRYTCRTSRLSVAMFHIIEQFLYVRFDHDGRSIPLPCTVLELQVV